MWDKFELKVQTEPNPPTHKQDPPQQAPTELSSKLETLEVH